MIDYFVKFNAYLVPATKPEGWENPVHQAFTFSVNNIDELRTEVTKVFVALSRQGGMLIAADTDKPLGNDTRTMDLNRFIPLHMIAWIQPETRLITLLSSEEVIN